MCKYCELKLKIDEDIGYEKYENSIELASGGWTTLYIGIDKDGNVVLRALGDGYTNDCLINFCPFCGRKVNKKYKKGNIVNG